MIFVRKIVFAVMATCLILPALAQDDENYNRTPSVYVQEWKDFEAFRKDGLPARQMEILDKLLERSVREKRAPEFFRALQAYPSVVSRSLRETEEKHALLAQFEKMSTTLPAPYSNIMHSFLGKQYYNGMYFWDLDSWGEDISIPVTVDGKTVYFTKDAKDQQAVIVWHLHQSMTNIDVLFGQKSSDYANPTYISDSVYFIKYPTLADVLAATYLDYFESYHPSSFPKPDPAWFGQTGSFVTEKSNDALKMHQVLELYHWKRNMDAYTSRVLDRLRYVSNLYFEDPKKNELYKEALIWLKTRLDGHPSTLGVICEQARIMLNFDPSYDWRTNPSARDKNQQVHDLVAKGLQQFPSSLYKAEAQSIVRSIEAKSINIVFEKPGIPGRSNLMTVHYSNVEQAYLTVYHIDRYKKGQENWQNPLKLQVLSKVHEQPLPLDINGKYNLHSKDFIIPGLEEAGQYLFLVTTSKDSVESVFSTGSLDKLSVAYTVAELHGFTMMHKVEQNRLEIVVTDILAGKPLSGVKVYVSNLNGTGRLLGQTNAEGMLSTALKDGENRLKLVNGKDSLLRDIYRYYGRELEENGPAYQAITDRGIYRPGQTVHFKVYAYKGKSPDLEVVGRQTVELSLLDDDGMHEVVARGMTNEFGTFAGTFKLPSSNMPGMRYLEINGKNVASFMVEEYKRPTFEIESRFDKESYKMGDKVTITGKVKAYAGYGIADAQVELAINYSQGFRYFRYGQEEFLVDTLIRTNAQGEFSYTFTATTNKRDGFGALFVYTASVTSAAGETQFASESIFIGRSRAEWEISFPTQVIAGDPDYGYVKVIQEDPQAPKQIEAELWKLNPSYKVPEIVYTQHEFQAFTAKEFSKKFGKNAAYFASQSKTRQLIRVSSFALRSSDSLLISKLVGNKAGSYKLALTYRTAQDTLRDTVSFVYIRPDSKKGQHQQPLWATATRKTYKPGDEAKVLIGSMFKKQDVLVEILRGNDVIRYEWIALKGRRTITYPVRKEDLGGVEIRVTAVRNGNMLQGYARIDVPFGSKELDVKLQTVRELLRPGAQEKWVVSVSAKDGSPLPAELAVGMSDVSLDRFASNEWGVQVYHDNYAGGTWQTNYIDRAYFSVYGSWSGGRYYPTRLGYSTDRYANAEVKTAAFADQQAASGTFAIEEFNSSPLTMDVTRELAPAERKEEKARSNFSETAFFYPQLTAKDDRFEFEFTLPDALTRWRFQALAHDKLMRLGYTASQLTAQKELMAEPNEPRFFRAGDEFTFAVSVINLTDQAQNVKATLEWFDPYTNVVIPNVFGTMNEQQVNLAAKGAQVVSWKLNIPKTGLDLIAYRVKVASDRFSDAEEKVIPVLSNRTQLIESIPVTVEGKGSYMFELPKLSRQASSTQRNEKLVFEYNSNPIWSAVMAIPYIADYPYDCSEQIFSKFFANRISQSIIEKNPVIAKVLMQPQTDTPDKFISELQKNEELRSIVLAETPWVLEARSETEQRRRITELFETNNLARREMDNLNKLQQMHNSDGGWSWFGNGRSNVYITQHILSGFGHLRSLELEIPEVVNISEALRFVDDHYRDQYKKLTKEQVQKKQGISALEVQWLYAREMLGADSTAAAAYYTSCLQRDWINFPLHIQAMAGVYFLHSGDELTAQKILASIRSKATYRKNLGTYWNENRTSWSWDRNAIETQASLIEFFKKAGADQKTLASMKLWLLNQKRGQYWESTKATAWACYALLIDAKPVAKLAQTERVFVGGREIAIPESGYVRQTFTGSDIQPAMGKVTISKEAEEPAFGSLSLVYTEEIDKVTSNTGGMQLQKQLYVVKGGQEMPLTADMKLNTGDLIRVHLQLSSDRQLDFVHVKDLRASGTENVDVISANHSSGVLYFYQVNRDASTEFFIDHLPKGKHTLTYDMRVSAKGVQSTGYAMVECLYAPEFRANTAAPLIRVE